jgi:sodium-dependent dicarboxylate transporter 2/3/5
MRTGNRFGAGIRILADPRVAALVYSAFGPESGLDYAARATAALAAWMAVGWMSEAIPVYATALVPLAVFPVLGIAGIRAAATPYGNPSDGSPAWPSPWSETGRA